MCSITAFAVSPVTPKTNFNYKGTDIAPSIETIYRSDHAYFKDEAEILTSGTEKDLWEKVQSTADYLNINIAVFIGGNYRTEDETVTFTVNSIESIFGKYSDSLFIYLDFEGYSPAYDHIRVFNKAEDMFSETKRNKILNAMYQDLPKSTEPIYEDAVSKGISKGLDEVKSQGYVNSIATSQPYNENNTTTPPPPQHTGRSDTGSEIENFFRNIPTSVIIGAIVVIVVLIILSSIVKSIRRRLGSGFGNTYNNSSYYNNNDNYYGRRSGFYSGSHYNRRPPRHRPPRDYGPPRNSRPSHNSPSSPPRSSNNNSSHNSGSGHYR